MGKLDRGGILRVLELERISLLEANIPMMQSALSKKMEILQSLQTKEVELSAPDLQRLKGDLASSAMLIEATMQGYQSALEKLVVTRDAMSRLRVYSSKGSFPPSGKIEVEQKF